MQEILAGEMLRPATPFKLIRDFTVGQIVSGRQVKIVARWQQYRAVRRMVRRLAERQQAITAASAPDPRGGVT